MQKNEKMKKKLEDRRVGQVFGRQYCLEALKNASHSERLARGAAKSGNAVSQTQGPRPSAVPAAPVSVLSSERINGQRAKTSRKAVRERVPPLQNSKKGHQKWAASPPTLRAGFSSFEGVERAPAWFFSRFSYAGH